jgi:ABC-type nitrate/sulfonate/bicarbonate transport system, ATPase component
LATSPTVLLLDEPFSALDTFTRSSLQQDVAAICKQKGITMVLVTHDIDEAVMMSDRVFVMDQNPGRIIDEIKVDLAWPRKHMSQDFQCIREDLMTAFKGTEKTESLRALDGGRSAA